MRTGAGNGILGASHPMSSQPTLTEIMCESRVGPNVSVDFHAIGDGRTPLSYVVLELGGSAL